VNAASYAQVDLWIKGGQGVWWTRASTRSPTLMECFVARARSLWLHLQIRWSLMLSA